MVGPHAGTRCPRFVYGRAMGPDLAVYGNHLKLLKKSRAGVSRATMESMRWPNRIFGAPPAGRRINVAFLTLENSLSTSSLLFGTSASVRRGPKPTSDHSTFPYTENPLRTGLFGPRNTAEQRLAFGCTEKGSFRYTVRKQLIAHRQVRPPPMPGACIKPEPARSGLQARWQVSRDGS